MMTAETKLRETAAAFLDAWIDAHAAGYRMVWPAQAQGLAFLVISETGAVGQSESKRRRKA